MRGFNSLLNEDSSHYLPNHSFNFAVSTVVKCFHLESNLNIIVNN